MRPIVTDRVAWSVGLSVTLVSPAETSVIFTDRSVAGNGHFCDLPTTENDVIS